MRCSSLHLHVGLAERFAGVAQVDIVKGRARHAHRGDRHSGGLQGGEHRGTMREPLSALARSVRASTARSCRSWMLARARVDMWSEIAHLSGDEGLTIL